MGKKPSVQKRSSAREEKIVNPQSQKKLLLHDRILAKENMIPGLMFILYLLVDFVPRFDAGDVMGSQWVYLSVLNISAILYILITKTQEHHQAVKHVILNPLSYIYLGLLVLVILSLNWGINKIESYIVFARFINAVVMYFIMAILMVDRLQLLKPLSQVIAFFLLIQAADTLSAFNEGLGENDLDKIIYYLKGNAGNKNILAASLVMKMGFTIYCMHISKSWWKLINAIILLFGALAIFILNARASYLSLALELVIFAICIILIQYKKYKPGQVAFHALSPLAAVLIAFFISQAMIKNALAIQEVGSAYGTVTERLGTISFTAEGSNARLHLWNSALDYIKHHPIKGSGFGNWKLASIPYEKTYVDNLLVTYHAHNDFLEIAAESGIAAGIIFIGLFICAFLFILKSLYKYDERINAIAILTLMLLAAYFIDAMLNFPMERPIMQCYFALMLACSMNLFIKNKKEASSPKPAKPAVKLIFGFAAIGFLLPALYLTYRTYQSLVAQSIVNTEMTKGKLQTRWQDIIDVFPSIPNMNAFCYPIDQVKALYLLEDKKYDEALSYINRSIQINPYLTLTEYLKARIFLATGKPDSAYFYGYTAFFNKPRAQSHYELLNEICIQKQDTATLTKAFNEYIKYRNEAWAWNRYLGIMMYMPNDQQALRALADSAVKIFPADAELQQKQSQLKGNQLAATTAQQQAAFMDYFETGLSYYNKRDFANAIKSFKKAFESNPNDFISVENIGLSYFATNNFSAAIPYFDKVISAKATQDGKSEYYRGICQLNIGQKSAGCQSLQLAAKKNYSAATSAIATNCN